MEYIVGIDVSKASLDCHNLQDGTSWKVSNNAQSWEELSSQLESVKLVVVEATGGYQEGLVDTLLAKNLPVAVVNPRQVRDFAKSAGRLAKTDRLDAEIIARFGLALNPTPQTSPSEIKELRDLVNYRDDLLKLCSAQKNRKLQYRDPAIRDSIRKSLDALQKEITWVDEKIQAFIQTNKAIEAKASVLQAVKGVGPVLTASLLGLLPELGQIDNKAIAALAGVAPFNCDSGKYRGGRRIWGGRKAVRKTLYMSALVAKRYNPLMKAYFEQLAARGKSFKVAIVACMRKLLVILNAKMRDYYSLNAAQTKTA